MSKHFTYIFLLILGLSIWVYGSNPISLHTLSNSTLEVAKITQKFANIYIVESNNKRLLIDAGNPHKAEKIVEKLKRLGISPPDIDYLILTHAHPDHAGNAAYFQKTFGTKLIAGKGDLELIQNKGSDSLLCPTGITGKIVKSTIAKKRYLPFTPDILLDKPFDLQKLGITGEIIPMSGHTSGSLVIKISNAVFVGDIIRGKTFNKEKPTRHIFVCDFENNLKNIQTISNLKGIEYWYPGHGGPMKQKDVLTFIEKEKLK